MRTFEDVVRERIRELRRQRGFTQQDLADALARLGLLTDRATVARIEIGQRRLTLNEAFAAAQALGVAPVHLFVPTDSNEPINIGPNMEASPAEMRAWIRGQRPMFQEARAYFSAVPENEFPYSEETHS